MSTQEQAAAQPQQQAPELKTKPLSVCSDIKFDRRGGLEPTTFDECRRIGHYIYNAGLAPKGRDMDGEKATIAMELKTKPLSVCSDIKIRGSGGTKRS